MPPLVPAPCKALHLSISGESQKNLLHFKQSSHSLDYILKLAVLHELQSFLKAADLTILHSVLINLLLKFCLLQVLAIQPT